MGLAVCSFIEDLNDLFRGEIRPSNTDVGRNTVGIFHGHLNQFNDRESNVFFAGIGDRDIAGSRHVPSLFFSIKSVRLLESTDRMLQMQTDATINDCKLGVILDWNDL